MEWLQVYVGFSSVLMVIMLIMIFHMNSKLANIKELWERVQDKLSHIYSGVDKIDTGLNWFLSREGVKVDYCHSNWRWMIVSRDDTSSIYRTLKDLDRDKREALAKALYEANLQAMRDFNKEQKKEAKKK